MEDIDLKKTQQFKHLYYSFKAHKCIGHSEEVVGVTCLKVMGRSEPRKSLGCAEMAWDEPRVSLGEAVEAGACYH